MKLIAIGDNVVDFYADQGMFYPGGNGLNVAVAAKRNGADACAYLGMVGDDAAARHVVSSMELESIDAARMRYVRGPNGEATVTLSEEGDRIFVGTNRGQRVASLLQLKLTDDDLSYIGTFDLIHTSVNGEIEHELVRLSSCLPIAFDFSTKKRWNEAYLQQICPHLAYAFFSGSDMEMDEIEQLITQVHALGVSVVGVTRGADPAHFSRDGVIYEQKPKAVEIVDTMGAGDSFIGAFLAAYHGRWDMRVALEQAAVAAAKTCTHFGAFGYGARKE